MPLHVTNMHSLDLSHGINSKSCPLIRDWTQHMHRMVAEVSNSVPSQFSHPLTSSNSEEGRDNQIIITQGKSGAVTKGYDTLIKGADGKINIVLMDGSSNCKYHTKNRAVDRIHKNTYHYQSQRDMPHHPNKHTFGTNLDNMHGAYDRKKAILLTMENCNRLSDKGQEKPKWDKSPTFVKKTKQIDCDQIGNTKQKRNKFVENMEKTPSVSNNIEQEPFPEFESFIVEEQEGSRGYGTVYRAKRKADGVAFAIKCPHVNANRNYVNNEIKMMERFG